MDVRFDEIYTEYLGAGACHGHLAGPPSPDTPEVEVRIGVKQPDLHTPPAWEVKPSLPRRPTLVSTIHSSAGQCSREFRYSPTGSGLTLSSV